MRKTSIIFLAAIFLFLLQFCVASSFFDIKTSCDSLYTPGIINVTLELTDNVKIEENYKFRISIYVAEVLVRSKVLPVIDKKPVTYEVNFPMVRNKTYVRCKTELICNNQLIEGKDKPLTLWPSLEGFPKEVQAKKVVWVYDTTGNLQELLRELNVEFTDAVFQPARTFSKPDIVFIGQNLDFNNMQIIENSLGVAGKVPVIIYLYQDRFDKEKDVQISTDSNVSKSIICDFNSHLLEGLDRLDLMSMTADVKYLKIRKTEDKERHLTSYVTEKRKEDKYLYSYLAVIQEKEAIIIYCQLRNAEANDPRYNMLLKNMLKYAYKESSQIKEQ